MGLWFILMVWIFIDVKFAKDYCHRDFISYATIVIMDSVLFFMPCYAVFHMSALLAIPATAFLNTLSCLIVYFFIDDTGKGGC